MYLRLLSKYNDDLQKNMDEIVDLQIKKEKAYHDSKSALFRNDSKEEIMSYWNKFIEYSKQIQPLIKIRNKIIKKEKLWVNKQNAFLRKDFEKKETGGRKISKTKKRRSRKSYNKKSKRRS